MYRGGVKARENPRYPCPRKGSLLFDWNKTDASGKPVTKTCDHRGFKSPGDLVRHIACHLVRTEGGVRMIFICMNFCMKFHPFSSLLLSLCSLFTQGGHHIQANLDAAVKEVQGLYPGRTI